MSCPDASALVKFVDALREMASGYTQPDLKAEAEEYAGEPYVRWANGDTALLEDVNKGEYGHMSDDYEVIQGDP